MNLLMYSIMSFTTDAFPNCQIMHVCFASGYHIPQSIFILKTRTGSFYDHETLHCIILSGINNSANWVPFWWRTLFLEGIFSTCLKICCQSHYFSPNEGLPWNLNECSLSPV